MKGDCLLYTSSHSRIQYTVYSVPTSLNPAERAAAAVLYPEFILQQYLQIPPVSPQILDLAQHVTQSATSVSQAVTLILSLIHICLVEALPPEHESTNRIASTESLKHLTGLPPSKALRALCIFFGVRSKPSSKWPLPAVTADTIDVLIRRHHNPFDLLTQENPASVLDLGAGDLSFAEELATLYEPQLAAQSRPLIFHCLDRLDPCLLYTSRCV